MLCYFIKLINHVGTVKIAVILTYYLIKFRLCVWLTICNMLEIKKQTHQTHFEFTYFSKK